MTVLPLFVLFFRIPFVLSLGSSLFLWIYRWLPFVCRVEGVAATIGLGCVTPLRVTFRLPFCLWLKPFLSCESVVDYFSSVVREEWQLPLFTLPLGCLFAFGGDPSFLVNPPFVPCLLCIRSLATVINVGMCESAVPRRWWTVAFSPDSFQKIFALDFLCFILLRGEMMVPTYQRWDYLLAFSSWIPP